MARKKLPFDLNLLRVLLALDRTRHVTRAAELLNMSQSGFSSALARLRRHCGDELFVRSAGAMIETAAARRYIDAAETAVATVERQILTPAVFEPATFNGDFRLVMADVAEIVFMPRLLEHLKRHAPRVSVRCQALPQETLSQALGDGTEDLALGYYPDLTSQAFYHQRLYLHTFACIVRRNHPLDRGKMTSAIFNRLGHVVVESPSRSAGLLEEWLRKHRIPRQVVLRTPHHMSLAGIIENSDLVATVPLVVAVWYARHGAVRVAPFPFKPPVFGVHQHWHRRYQHDPRHSWLRQQISHLFNERSDDWRDVENELYGYTLREEYRRSPKSP
jgi:DNA-binding transcriptional LysR family regulator